MARPRQGNRQAPHARHGSQAPIRTAEPSQASDIPGGTCRRAGCPTTGEGGRWIPRSPSRARVAPGCAGAHSTFSARYGAAGVRALGRRGAHGIRALSARQAARPHRRRPAGGSVRRDPREERPPLRLPVPATRSSSARSRGLVEGGSGEPQGRRRPLRRVPVQKSDQTMRLRRVAPRPTIVAERT